MRATRAPFLTLSLVLLALISATAQSTPPPTVAFSFGGNGLDFVNAVTTDADGAVYVAGRTASTDLPGTANAFQRTLRGGTDAFVAKFDSSGRLIWSTYLGGNDGRTANRFSSAYDEAKAIAVDSQGNVVVAGFTGSTDFPTVNAFQTGPQSTRAGSTDGFLAKLDPTGSRLLYSTYLGGPDDRSSVEALALGASGDAYVAINTAARQFRTTFDVSNGAGSLVIGRFLSTGASVWLTRTGFGDDTIIGFAVDGTSQPHLASHSPRATCARGTAPVCPSWSVEQFDLTGSRHKFRWSFVPNSSSVRPTGDLALTPDGTIVLSGGAIGLLDPLNAWQPAPHPSGNGFVAMLTPQGEPTVISYVAGAVGPKVVADLGGVVHVASSTTIAMLPTERAVMSEHPDGPIFTSWDRGRSWRPVANGLPSGAFTDLAIDPRRNFVYASTWSGTYRTADNGATWTLWSNVPGNLAIDPRDPTTMYGGHSDLFRSDQDGRAVTMLRQSTPGAGGSRVSALAVSPHDGAVWLCTGRSLEVSFDRGATWTPRQAGIPVGSFVEAIAIDRRTPGLLYVGAGRVYRSRDNGESWEAISPNLGVRQVLPDPVDADRLHAATLGRIYMTRDAGVTWSERLNPGWTHMAANHASPYELYALSTTPSDPLRLTILVSSDRGDTWRELEGAPHPRSGISPRIAIHPLDAARLYLSGGGLADVPYLLRLEARGEPRRYERSFASYVADGMVADVAVTLTGQTVLAVNRTASTGQEIRVVKVAP